MSGESADVHDALVLVQSVSGGSATATVGGGLVLAFLADLVAVAIEVVLIVQEARSGRALRNQARANPAFGSFAHPVPAPPSATCSAPLSPSSAFCSSCGARQS